MTSENDWREPAPSTRAGPPGAGVFAAKARLAARPSFPHAAKVITIVSPLRVRCSSRDPVSVRIHLTTRTVSISVYVSGEDARR